MTRKQVLAAIIKGDFNRLEKLTGLKSPVARVRKMKELSKFFCAAYYLAEQAEKESRKIGKLKCSRVPENVRGNRRGRKPRADVGDDSISR